MWVLVSSSCAIVQKLIKPKMCKAEEEAKAKADEAKKNTSWCQWTCELCVGKRTRDESRCVKAVTYTFTWWKYCLIFFPFDITAHAGMLFGRDGFACY